MVLNYYGLSKKPKLFRNFTGFTVSEFDDIYKKLEEKYGGYERERLDMEDRRRVVGGGRKFKLLLMERFLMPTNTEPPKIPTEFSRHQKSKILKVFGALKSGFCGLFVYYRLYITPLQASFLILMSATCGETPNIWDPL